MSPQLTVALQTNKPLAEYGQLAAQVEAYGFDGITVYNDMLYQPAWLPLLEMARRTSMIRLGPAAINPFTCHPINIAGNIALIDEMSQGRAYCGFARGGWLDFVGLKPRRAVAALREAMICVRHLLSGSREPLAGEHFPLAGGDTLRWEAVRPNIPFLLGTWGTRTLQACKPFATEIKLGGTANPGAVAWLRALIGRSLDIVVGAVTVVDEDGDAARALARREVALYLPVVVDLDPTAVVDPERITRIKTAMARFDTETAAAQISDDLLAQFALAGTPAQIVSQTRALISGGSDRVEFGTPHGLTTASGLALLGEKVLPALRQP